MTSRILEPYLVYDIETGPNERSHAYYMRKKYYAPSNYKDPAKIEEAIREKRADDMKHAALRWWTARITSVAATPVNMSSVAISYASSKDDEKALLIEFFAYLTHMNQQSAHNLILCGAYSDDFDLPMIIGRAMYHDIGIPDVLRGWRKMTDINLIFGFSSRSDQRGKLDDYAWGVGIDGKTGTGMEALDLWNLVLSGDEAAREKLVRYNQHDVSITAEILRRYLKPFSAHDVKATIEAPLDIPFGGPVG